MNLSLVNTQGESPLHVAVKHGYIQMVKVLLYKGVYLHSKDW